MFGWKRIIYMERRELEAGCLVGRSTSYSRSRILCALSRLGTERSDRRNAGDNDGGPHLRSITILEFIDPGENFWWELMIAI
jgi:hypothetical protein